MSLKKLILESENGYFGEYGGRYIPEMIIPVIDELKATFFQYITDKNFLDELHSLYKNYSGRPTPLYYCKNLTNYLGGAKIYLKNEGLNHTGAHKINHCIGQGLLAKRLGKKRVIAETGAGQHGLATATICAKLGLECVIYMGKKDYDRQRPNVFWMECLGATVKSVDEGSKTLRDAVNAALKDLISHPKDTHYLLGTSCGPHPYPVMNTFFQSIIGAEVRTQLLTQENKLPDYLIACVGGGSNSLGLFSEFLDDQSVKMIGVEAGGKSITEKTLSCDHAARMQTGSIGVIEGFKSYVLQNKEGQIKSTTSISAGLDYSSISPQLSYLKDIGRVKFSYALNKEVLKTHKILAREEGIIAALESLHALVEVCKLAPNLSKDKIIVFNCSGRGDKDLFIVGPLFDRTNFNYFIKNFS